MRCFLVGKVLREKCFDTLWGMFFRVTNLNKCTPEGEMALRQMKARRNDSKVLTKDLDEEEMIQ